MPRFSKAGAFRVFFLYLFFRLNCTISTDCALNSIVKTIQNARSRVKPLLRDVNYNALTVNNIKFIETMAGIYSENNRCLIVNYKKLRVSGSDNKLIRNHRIKIYRFIQKKVFPEPWQIKDC